MGFYKLIIPSISKVIQICQIGKYFVLPNYQYYEYKSKLAFKEKTPLLVMTVANYQFTKDFMIQPVNPKQKGIAKLNFKSKIAFISLTGQGHCNAHKKVLVNKNRQLILRTLNNSNIPLQGSNIINIRLKSICHLATEQQITNHLTQLLKHYTQTQSRKVDNSNKIALRDNIDISSIIKHLFDFDIQRWLTFRNLCAKDKYFYFVGYTERSSFMFAHYFQIAKSQNLINLSADIREFIVFLEKMNIVQFLNELYHSNQMKNIEQCVKLIRIMQWRTAQTEEYLVFYLRNFNRKQFLENLRHFPKISEQYIKSKRIVK